MNRDESLNLDVAEHLAGLALHIPFLALAISCIRNCMRPYLLLCQAVGVRDAEVDRRGRLRLLRLGRLVLHRLRHVRLCTSHYIISASTKGKSVHGGG